MNPTLAQTLDPKLKEAYDRVMGTQTSPSQPPTPAPNVPPASTIEQPVTVPPTPTSFTPPIQPSPAHSEPAEPVEPVTQVYHAQAQPVSTTTLNSQKKSKISWWVFVLMGLAFFIVYTLVWIRVFNVSLPF